MPLSLTEQPVDGPFTFCFFCTDLITAPRAGVLRDHPSTQTIGCVCSTCVRVQPEHLKAAVAGKIHQAHGYADLLFAQAAPFNKQAPAHADLLMAQAEHVNTYAHDLECLLSSLDTPLTATRR